MAHVLIAIFGISLLMIVHEAGHYFMARAFGMRVTVFSIGLGPAIVKVQPKGSPTVFQICAIPFLAYVRIAGMNPLEENDPKDSGLYENKSAIARALTVLGGPLANYLAATLMIFVVAMIGWREQVPTTPMVVAAVEAGAPADKAGMRAGDVILEVEGKAIRDVRELAEMTGPRAGQPTMYTLQRDGSPLAPLTIVPRDAAGRGVLGVMPKVETRTRTFSVGEAAGMAIALPWMVTVENVQGMADLARRHSTEGITGPVGMVKQVALEAEKGIYAFVAILIVLSIALGFFNLLPLPFLDGGRLIFLACEIVAGRRPNQKLEVVVHAIGLLLLLGVTALVTLRDVVG
jgi:regulator of sigma E protease